MAGIRYLQVLSEAEGSSQRELLWELRPDQGFDLWELGRVSVEARQNYKIVLEALRGDEGSGLVKQTSHHLVIQCVQIRGS